MAKYKSLLELSGSIGDLVFYHLNGVPVVRKKSGFNKDAYQNNPNYRKVRENSSEFGHCSKAGKLIRKELESYMGDCGDKYLYQKFAKVMTQIKDMDDVSERGKRRIENGLKKPESLQLLSAFTFGTFENINDHVLSEEGFFTKTITLKDKTEADIIELITLKPDLENLTIEARQQSQNITSKQKTYEFDHLFDEASPLLYFLILKKGNQTISAGFVA